MNVLFLTLVGFETLQDRNLYTDLLREFTKHGHRVFVISPIEKRYHKETHLIQEENATILRLQIGNTQTTSIIEKGISTVMLEPQIKKAVKKYFSDVKFDLVLYSTPPITLVSPIRYVKKRDGARTYLLLKDIFPQNAVDIGLMNTTGIKGLLYKHFRRQEKKLYRISDRIGCMSQANVDYLTAHNPEIDPRKVEVCPNSIEVVDKSVDEETKKQIRIKYGIPLDKMVFVYGGNLGKPQGIPFLIECLKKCEDMEDTFFLIVGDGTEAYLIRDYIGKEKPKNVKYMKTLPKEDYDNMVGACDVGLIFVDHRFTIPNFPSRLLAYMAAKLLVLACTDPNTDIGKVIEEGGFGWKCDSSVPEKVVGIVKRIGDCNLLEMKEKSFRFLLENYNVTESYNKITKDKK